MATSVASPVTYGRHGKRIMYDADKPLDENLKEFSRLAYLLAYATDISGATDAGDVVNGLEQAVRNQCHDPERLSPGSIKMKPAEVESFRQRLPGFLADLLIIALDTFLHARLAAACDREASDTASPYEEDLSRLWPKERRTGKEWAYKDVILLAEVRNAIVHADGIVKAHHQRLADAGWSEEALNRETCLRQRSFGHFLRFKRAVRTIANEVAQAESVDV